MKQVFGVVDYDVWGNEVDGWEVNTIYRTDFKIPYKKFFSSRRRLNMKKIAAGT